MAGKLVEYPFDTVKVRLQSQPDNSALRYKGPLDCFRQTIAHEGFVGLYRGISSPIVGAMAENACLFFTYNYAQSFIKTELYPTAPSLPLSGLLIAGAISGAFTSFVLTPVELIKCKLQVQLEGQAGLRHTIKLPGPIALVRSVYHSDGLKGFWRGQLGTFFRESGGSAAWFGAYEYVTKLTRESRGPLEKNTSSDMLLAGACAGMSYNLVLFPADTVKSRMQTARDVVDVTATAKPGFWQVASIMWKNGGIRSFYRGCGITTLRAAPSSAVITPIMRT